MLLDWNYLANYKNIIIILTESQKLKQKDIVCKYIQIIKYDFMYKIINLSSFIFIFNIVTIL